jgi:hypothetical protein
MRRYEIFYQVNTAKKYWSTQPFLQVGPISECKNTINTGQMCAFEENPRKKRKHKCAEEI